MNVYVVYDLLEIEESFGDTHTEYKLLKIFDSLHKAEDYTKTLINNWNHIEYQICEMKVE